MMPLRIPAAPSIAYYKKIGWIFQRLLVGGIFIQLIMMFFKGKDESPEAARMIGFVGAVIFVVHMQLIYRKKDGGLITTGFFKYTRHPMYTGAAMMGVHIWWPSQNDFLFTHYVSFAMFVTGLLVAGYLQEKETLLLYGSDAEEYYKRTPRFFFLYPFYLLKGR